MLPHFYRKDAESFIVGEHTEFSMMDPKLRCSLTNFKSRQSRGGHRGGRGSRYEPYNKQYTPRYFPYLFQKAYITRPIIL